MLQSEFKLSQLHNQVEDHLDPTDRKDEKPALK